MLRLIPSLSLKFNNALSVSGINRIALLHSSAIDLKGHSKWQNIKETKGKNDTQRSKKISFYLSKARFAIKEGGFDIKINKRLQAVQDSFREHGLPLDIFTGFLKKMKEKPEVMVQYNILGPSGTVFIIECETSSVKATQNTLKKYMNKVGGFRFAADTLKGNFEEKGVITISEEDNDDKKLTLDEVEEEVIEYDIEEVEVVEGDDEKKSKQFALYCDKNDLYKIESKISESRFVVENAEIKIKPLHFVSISEEEKACVDKFYEMLTNFVEVRNIYDNVDYS